MTYQALEERAREVELMRRLANDWRRPSLAQIEGPDDLKIYGATIADDIDRWADMLALAAQQSERGDLATPSPSAAGGDREEQDLRDFASLMVDEVIAKTRIQLQCGVGLSVEDQTLLLEQLIVERKRLAATPASGPKGKS